MNLCLLLLAFNLYGQTDPREYNEQMKLIANHDVLVSGENLELSVRVQLEDQSFQISRLAYVEIISSKGEPVIQEKVELDNSGKGQASIYIPLTVETGNYLLFGSTKWMRNFGSTVFPKQQITIVNPFKKISTDQFEKIESGELNELVNQSLQIELDRKKIGTRDSVNITLSSDESFHGSLLVRMKRPSLGSDRIENTQSDVEDITVIHLPDFNGEMISGQVIDSRKNPIGNKPFTIHTGDQNAIIYQLVTNAEGNFEFLVDPENTDELVVQGINSEAVIFDSPYLGSYDFVDLPNKINLDIDSIDSWLLSRAQQIQVGDIYNNIQMNNQERARKRIVDTSPVIYSLDDYTRFPTLEDPIIEYIQHLELKRNGSSKELYVRNVPNRTLIQNNVLTCLNWIPLPLTEILTIDQSMIQQVEIYPVQFDMGSEGYTGAVNFSSYQNTDPFEMLPDYSTQVYPYQSPVQSNQIQPTTVDIITPDLRDVLLWIPHLSLDAELTSTFVVRTSDLSGEFEIILKGMIEEDNTVKKVDFSVGRN